MLHKHRPTQYLFTSLLVVLLLSCCQKAQEVEVSIRRCADMPQPCASAVGFSINGEGYVFGGRTDDKSRCNHLYKYTPSTDTWTEISGVPLKARVNAMAQVAGDYVYIGLGFNGYVYRDSCYLRDFWRYNPMTNEWSRLADFPNTNTIRPVTYTVGDCIYVTYGSGPGFSREVNIYDIKTDTWSQLPYNSKRAWSGHGKVGATCQGRQFIGGGFNTRNIDQWYEMDLEHDTWTKRTDIPHGARTLATCTANSRYVYVMGGRYWGGDLTTGHLYGDILRYSPETDSWEACGTMPFGETENLVSFTIDEHVYFGLGEDMDGNVHNQLYCIE